MHTMKALIFSLLMIQAHATTFLLVRHGQTDWNKYKIWQGDSDAPLNETGQAQISELAETFKDVKFDHCITSSYKRAKESASLLTKLEPQIDARLRERGSRNFDGVPHGTHGKDIKKEYEDSKLVSERVFAALNEATISHPDKHILVSTHGGIIKQTLVDILNLECPIKDIKVPNASAIQISHKNGKWQVDHLYGVTLP
jgi:broad specificity phosphatase PhoE